ncbi:hypothetical protein MK489_24075 [Myxococcota bacterium]|nr:hypothetical protein [Myxococcota bacterium]
MTKGSPGTEWPETIPASIEIREALFLILGGHAGWSCAGLASPSGGWKLKSDPPHPIRTAMKILKDLRIRGGSSLDEVASQSPEPRWSELIPQLDAQADASIREWGEIFEAILADLHLEDDLPLPHAQRGMLKHQFCSALRSVWTRALEVAQPPPSKRGALGTGDRVRRF